MPGPWHVYPEQAAAGLWTTPSDLARFIIEVQTAVRGPEGSRAVAGVGAGDGGGRSGSGRSLSGCPIQRRGEGWTSRTAARTGASAPISSGTCARAMARPIMTNGDNGTALIDEIEDRLIAAYNWEALGKPLVR